MHLAGLVIGSVVCRLLEHASSHLLHFSDNLFRPFTSTSLF